MYAILFPLHLGKHLKAIRFCFISGSGQHSAQRASSLCGHGIPHPQRYWGVLMHAHDKWIWIYLFIVEHRNRKWCKQVFMQSIYAYLGTKNFLSHKYHLRKDHGCPRHLWDGQLWLVDVFDVFCFVFCRFWTFKTIDPCRFSSWLWKRLNHSKNTQTPSFWKPR